jgi:hypothetical protein
MRRHLLRWQMIQRSLHQQLRIIRHSAQRQFTSLPASIGDAELEQAQTTRHAYKRTKE